MLLMIIVIVTAFFAYPSLLSPAAGDASFDGNYIITYGYDHVKFLNQERSELQISLDSDSGAGFGSKVKYGSGFFKISLKLIPSNDSAGVVTTFYLHSGTREHDELDIEFLGNKAGKPITLQTNVFANGVGSREQRMLLWFDPSADYHTYKILWNPHQIVFFVDEIPIRVYKNNTEIEAGYPTQPMQVMGSIWNGDSWATAGGRSKINWSEAPFRAHFKGFDIDGCGSSSTTNHDQDCSSLNPNYWWNQDEFWKLSEVDQEANYRYARKHINYDYCTDTIRFPVSPPECATNTLII